MDIRESLYAQATAELSRSSGRLGTGALGLAILASIVGWFSTNTADHWLSAMLWVWSFFCLTRYGGDSKELRDLQNKVIANPPSLPLPPPTHNDEYLIQAYGKAMGRFAGQSAISVSKLPASKARIKAALLTAATQPGSADDRTILREGYLFLSAFQPLPLDSHSTAVLAAAQEHSELEKEWQSFITVTPLPI